MTDTRNRPVLVPLADEIARRRLARALSQQALARRAGLAVSSVKKVESRNPDPVSTRTVLKIAEALDCEPDEISEVREAAS